MRTYSVKDGDVIGDVNKHVSGCIGGVRRLVFLGMTEAERERLRQVAERGGRLSYNVCTDYRIRGSCKWGTGCTHPHVG